MIVIDLSTPEKFKKFEKAYAKALTAHMAEQTKPFDLEAVAKEAGVVETPKTNPTQTES
jgi:hypothetical protein